MGGVGKTLAGFGKALVKVHTGGMVDLDKGRVNAPFSGAAMRNSASAFDRGLIPGARLGRVVSDAGKAFTYGMVNLEKGRVNVPFSSAQTRDFGKGIANLGTAGQLRGDIDKSLDSKTARLAGTVAGSVLGAAAGAGVGSAVGPSVGIASGTAELAGGSAGGYAAQQVNQAGDAQHAERQAADAERQGIASAQQAAAQLEAQKKAALKAAEDAALAVQTREAEARRRRASKQAQTVLTGSYGLTGQSPVGLQTLSPAPARRSVLG